MEKTPRQGKRKKCAVSQTRPDNSILLSRQSRFEHAPSGGFHTVNEHRYGPRCLFRLIVYLKCVGGQRSCGIDTTARNLSALFAESAMGGINRLNILCRAMPAGVFDPRLVFGILIAFAHGNDVIIIANQAPPDLAEFGKEALKFLEQEWNQVAFHLYFSTVRGGMEYGR